MTRPFGVLLLAVAVAAQSAPTAPPPPGSPPSKMAQAANAYRQNDFARARALFRDVIAQDPNNPQAHEMDAQCSMRLKDYAAGVESYLHALQLRPDAPHLLASLMWASTLASLTSVHDSTRDRIRHLQGEGRIRKDFYYVFDAFDIDGGKVQVSEFPTLEGHTEFPWQRYQFDLISPSLHLIYRVTLEAPEYDQAAWAKQHPAEAAAGQRRFSLLGYGGHIPDANATYRVYDGEPAYERVREDVRQIFLGQLRAISGETYAPIPNRD